MFSLSSFNIKCFGTNGVYHGDFGSELRVNSIKSFLEDHLKSSDIIIFQEIVDVKLLKTILPEHFKITTYKRDYNQHQFVVAAHNSERLEVVETTPISETAINETVSRPALYLSIKDKTVSDSKSLTVIGTHLKSGDEKYDLRAHQISKIITFIKSLSSEKRENIVIMGDFNAPSEDEKKNIDQMLAEIELTRAPLNQYTYTNRWEKKELDLCYLSQNLKDFKLITYDMFRHKDNDNGLELYNQEISDHSPITLSVKNPFSV